MSLLFYCDEKAGIILRPDCYKLSPVLSKLDEKEMLFVILSQDYHSIYRQFPEQDRIRRAMFHVFDDNKPELLKDQRILDAIEAYRSLQYNPDIEQVNRFQKKIDSLLQKLDEDDSPSQNKSTLSVISDLRKSIRDIQNEVVEAIKDEGQIKGNKNLSFLEKLQRNQKVYDSVIAKK
jgi:hypothetical protein